MAAGSAAGQVRVIPPSPSTAHLNKPGVGSLEVPPALKVSPPFASARGATTTAEGRRKEATAGRRGGREVGEARTCVESHLLRQNDACGDGRDDGGR